MRTAAPFSTSIDIFSDFLQFSIVVLFMALFGIIYYVLRTSGQREQRLVNLLEQYALHLRIIAEQVRVLSRNVENISELLERIQPKSTGGINVSGGRVSIGRDAVGGDESKGGNEENAGRDLTEVLWKKS
jgi:hypothetical protein